MSELELRRVGLQLQAAHRFLHLANALTEVKRRHRRGVHAIHMAAPWAVGLLSAMLLVRLSRRLVAPAASRTSSLILRTRMVEVAIGLYLVARFTWAMQAAKRTIPNQLRANQLKPRQLGPGRPS